MAASSGTRVMPPGPIVNSRVTNWLALPRALATVMARCSVFPSSTKLSRTMLSTMELTGKSGMNWFTPNSSGFS